MSLAVLKTREASLYISTEYMCVYYASQVVMSLQSLISEVDIPNSHPRPALLMANDLLVPLPPLLVQLPLYRALCMLQHRHTTSNHVTRQYWSLSNDRISSWSRMYLVPHSFWGFDHVFPRTDFQHSI